MKYFINEDINDDKIVVNNKEYTIKEELNEEPLKIQPDHETSNKLLNHDLGNLNEGTRMERDEIISELKKLPRTSKYYFPKYSDGQLWSILDKEQKHLAKLKAKDKEANELFKAWEETKDRYCPECGERLKDNGECPICKQDDLEYIEAKHSDELKESFNMSADEFKKRVIAKWGAADESLNEDVNDLTDEEFNTIYDILDAHRYEIDDNNPAELYLAAYYADGEFVDIDKFQHELNILYKETIEDIIYEEMPEVYDRIKDIPADSMCRDLDLYDYWGYINEDEIDEIIAAEEARERENRPWNAADDKYSEVDESLDKNKTLLEEANNYLNDQWNSQSEKVRDSYKKLLRLENIPMDEDLVDWAVDDCCIKHNQSRDNIREMLNKWRGK